MDDLHVGIEKRITTGKGQIHRLKRGGLIPGILYGVVENLPVSVERDTMEQIFRKSGEDIFLTLELEGQSIPVAVKEVQRDPLTKELLHIDFMPWSQGVLH